MLHQKRSELLRLLFIVALLALTVGVMLVLSANNPTSTVMTTPSIINASANQTLNFTITNPTGSTEIDAVRVQRASGFTTIDCGVKLPPGWSCDDTTSAAQVDFWTTGTGIAAGESVPFMINGIAPATTGNQTFIITPYEGSLADGTQNTTLNPVNATVTVDADAPRILSLNLYNSSGAIVANETTLAEGAIYLRLTDFIFNITVFDTGGGSPSKAAIYYNNTLGLIESNIDVPNPDDSGGNYAGVLTMSNASGLKIPYTNVSFNATLLNSSLSANDSITIAIVANDTVQNRNVTTGSFKMPDNYSASYFFNITLDGNAPLIYNITMGGANTAVKAYNLTNSSAEITLSVNVNDTNFGGSGVGSVVVYTSDSATTTALTRSGASNVYNYTGTLASLGATTGDHKLRLTVLAVDAVGNENSTYFDLEIDDDAPTFTATVTVNGTAVNSTNNFVSNNLTQLNFSVTVNGNINVSHNATINGPNDVVFQMLPGSARESGNIAYNGSVVWFTINASKSPRSNLTQYGCPDSGDGRSDGLVCQLQFNATDIFGRVNSTNFTITFDDVPPAVVNITMNNTAATERNNIAFKAGTKLAFGVNAYNNIWNVTIGTAGTSSFTHNMTAAGTNYSFTLNVSDVCGHQGPCLVNFTATDLARNINFSNASFLILRDDITPNITAPAVSGGNFTGPGSLSNITLGILDPVRIARSDRIINLTVNSIDSNSTSTVLNVTVQNSTAATMALWNDSVSDWYNITTLASLGCSANVEAQCILTFNATDNASNINNSVSSPNQFNLTFRVDDLAPRVLNFSTNLINGVGRNVTSSATVINFSVNISEANIWNVTIENTTIVRLNASTTTTSNTTTVTYWAPVPLSNLGCTNNGNCYIHVNATDLAGNINSTQTITVTLDSNSLALSNLTTDVTFNISTPTFYVNTTANAQCRYSTTGVINYSQMSTQFTTQGGRHNSATLSVTPDGTYTYRISCVDVAGGNVFTDRVTFTIATTPSVVISNLTSGATFISSKPTIHVNTSENANCRYSTTGATNYSEMSAQFTTQGGRHNSFTIADTLDNTYNNYAVSCINTFGGDAARGTTSFTIDTTPLWNITIGATGALSATKDYFTEAKTFYTFRLPKTNILDTTTINPRYNVTDVLTSVMGSNLTQGTATNNVSIIYAYNRTGNSWTSFVFGRATNTFTNFTSDVMDYYINFTVANERIEIN